MCVRAAGRARASSHACLCGWDPVQAGIERAASGSQADDSVLELGTMNGMATDGVGYVRVRDASIAYRVLGDRGPFLAILRRTLFPGLLFAEHPATRGSIEWACRFGRPVVFDVQGSGRSDPLPQGVAASVEHEAEQLIAVSTAAGKST